MKGHFNNNLTPKPTRKKTESHYAFSKRSTLWHTWKSM